LGDDADYLLGHTAKAIPAEDLCLPGPDFVDRVAAASDRSPQVLRNLQALFGHGRLAGTGYVSILPVDQGVEHSGAASFAPNPAYFDPENIVRLAVEGGCNAVASTFGVLGAVARRWAHRIPFIVKINHNELLSHPNSYDQVAFGSVERAHEPGAAGISSGAPQVGREIIVWWSDADYIGPDDYNLQVQWERLDAPDSTDGEVIAGATEGVYTPVAADEGKWLRVTFTYDDVHGDDKEVSAVTANAVAAQ